jgi:hypothetical protein
MEFLKLVFEHPIFTLFFTWYFLDGLKDVITACRRKENSCNQDR